MATSSPILSIASFVTESFSEWEVTVVRASFQCFTQRLDGTGLAGWILSAEVFAQIPESTHPWRPVEDVERVTNAETTSQRATFVAERQGMTILRTAIIGSISNGILTLAPGYDHSGPLRAAAISMPDLMKWLRTTYGQRTVPEHAALIRQLRDSWDGTSIEDLIGRHLRSRYRCRSCIQPDHARGPKDRLFSTIRPQPRF